MQESQCSPWRDGILTHLPFRSPDPTHACLINFSSYKSIFCQFNLHATVTEPKRVDKVFFPPPTDASLDLLFYCFRHWKYYNSIMQFFIY
jgi:hypothetical protein